MDDISSPPPIVEKISENPYQMACFLFLCTLQLHFICFFGFFVVFLLRHALCIINMSSNIQSIVPAKSTTIMLNNMNRVILHSWDQLLSVLLRLSNGAATFSFHSLTCPQNFKKCSAISHGVFICSYRIKWLIKSMSIHQHDCKHQKSKFIGDTLYFIEREELWPMLQPTTRGWLRSFVFIIAELSRHPSL